MALLIDGYNLIHAANIVGPGRGPGGLARARTALMNLLAATLDERELKRTLVVFDAREAPFGLPRSGEHRGVPYRFAPRTIDADTLIEELIRADSAPKSLTVVSSDHRLQRAARKRRAKAVNSDVWFAGLLRERNRAKTAAKAPLAKREPELSPTEVQYWLKQFALSDAEAQAADEALADEFFAEDPSRSPHESQG